MIEATVPITGRKVLIWMIAFFATVFAVNGVFVFYALDSWPGLVADKAYLRGVNYNEVLDSAEAQTRRGWVSTIEYRRQAGDVVFEVRLTDADGAPLSGLKTSLLLRRPLGDGPARAADMTETAPGAYTADPAAFAKGRWYATVTAGEDYRLRHEVWIGP